MAEKLQSKSYEQHGDGNLEKEGSELSKQLAAERERSAAEKEKSSAEHEDSARHEVEKAVAEQEKKDNELAKASPAERRRETPKNTKAARAAAYKKEMKRVQAELSTPERAFSKVIHNKAVEKASEGVGATIARPNAILYGSMFAFFLTAGLYFWARHVGYPLSGFETIAAFIIGWLVGLIIDYVRLMISGGRA